MNEPQTVSPGDGEGKVEIFGTFSASEARARFPRQEGAGMDGKRSDEAAPRKLVQVKVTGNKNLPPTFPPPRRR